jgi:hypothetical protein
MYAVAVLSGGFLGHIDLRLPYLIFTLVSLISTFAALYLFEPPFSKENKKSNIQITLEGLKQFKLPSLKPYLLPAWLLLFIYFIFDWGMAKPAMGVKFGFFEREQGIIYTIISIIAVVAFRYLPEIRKKINNLNGLYLLNIVVLVAFSVALFPLGFLGFIPIMLIETVGSFSDPWISTIMNQHIDSRYRATTLSALQMVGRLPYLLINPIVGYLVDQNQTNTVFLMLIIIIVCVLGVSRLLSTRHQSLGTVD